MNGWMDSHFDYWVLVKLFTPLRIVLHVFHQVFTPLKIFSPGLATASCSIGSSELKETAQDDKNYMVGFLSILILVMVGLPHF